MSDITVVRAIHMKIVDSDNTKAKILDLDGFLDRACNRRNLILTFSTASYCLEYLKQS
ncbi:predicted protein [Botrytis cinerea T4]|uniref:Uncharacterized protein n=1 Tax=Botryotinia fuckeliana (strain T4) TaxID=999810 RepID=G2YFM8_BOTF4|nr:predicted protein [Botrytis cinerea T4]